MAFDAGFLHCMLREIDAALSGARVEKVLQPEKDEIVLQMRKDNGNFRLLLSASSSTPRIHLTALQKENPVVPPSFCMLLRKHLSGARFISAKQIGFERAYRLTFSTRDEMGYDSVRVLIGEIMGKCSNLMLADGEDRILAPLKTVDFTTSSRRQVLPGMRYELPPPQGKIDPYSLDREGFLSLFENASPGEGGDSFLSSRLLGLSSLAAREIVFSVSGGVSTPLSDLSPDALYDTLFSVLRSAETGGEPRLVLTPEGDPVEYSFFDIRQYGGICRKEKSFSYLTDLWFGERDKKEHIRRNSGDLRRILSTNLSRLTKKVALLQGELSDCAKKDKWKKYGDLLTANLYRLGGKNKSARTDRVVLTDYETGEEIDIPLDVRFSPCDNAQKYYKKYAKAKRSEIELQKQIGLASSEILYLRSVSDLLDRASDVPSLDAIREELVSTGYIRKKGGNRGEKKRKQEPFRFLTPGGLTVLCGKNNAQNEEVTFRTAAKNDFWFHVKNAPGSHTVLLCEGNDPPDEDMTFAASVAAAHSSLREEPIVEVQYTRVRNLHKPSGALPGFVTFDRYKSTMVRPIDPQAKE